MRDSQKSRSQRHNPVALGRGPIRAILSLALVALFALVTWIISPSPPRRPRHAIRYLSARRRLYNNILEGSSITPADRDYLVSLMARMAPVATDGFGQLFGMAGLDPRPQAAVKQGWMCSPVGSRNAHSTAVLGPDNRYVTAILTSYDESLPYSYGQETATEVARLMLSELAL